MLLPSPPDRELLGPAPVNIPLLERKRVAVAVLSMRKKEPLSPAMAAEQGCGPPLSHAAYAEALDRKREALDREVAAFTARKEEEYRDFERRLSVSAAAPGDLELEKAEETHEGANGDGTTKSSREARLALGNARDTIQPSPTTPRHDKERELQGLFLPHFIPLLDDPPVKRPTSPLAQSSGAGLPAQRTEIVSPDPSAYSPRTSPSPTLLASPLSSNPPTPTSIDTLLAPKQHGARAITPTPSNTSSSSSEPVSPSAIPSHLRPSSRSVHGSRDDSNGSSATLGLKPERPSIGTRNSSTQSDASTTSLKSSLRRSNSHHLRNGSHHKKKHVRISIGDLAVAPSESPVQTRSAFKPPTYSRNADFSLAASDEMGLELDDDRGRVDARDLKAGKARIDDEGGARRRRKKRVVTGSTASPGAGRKARADEPLDYFPPQPLRSPSLPAGTTFPSGWYGPTDINQPTTPTTPPSFAAAQEEFENDDPLFGGGKESPRQGPQTDEDLFRDDEDGREDMDVVNGHDLVEDEEDDGLALPSPSPHASSMPMAIRSGGWRMGKGP